MSGHLDVSLSPSLLKCVILVYLLNISELKFSQL